MRQAKDRRRSSHHVRLMAEGLEGRRLLAAIASDQTVTSTIGVLGETDDYTIDAVAGETLAAFVANTGATAMNPRVSIIAPGGATLQSSVGSVGANAFVDALAVTGTYTIRVIDDGNNATGTYTLTAAKTTGTPASNDGNGGAILSGQRKTGTISLGDVDVFTFVASAGDSIELANAETTANASFTPEIAVYKPNGGLLDYNYNGTGTVLSELNLATAGTYTVLIFNNAGNSSLPGDYALSLAKLPGTVNADATDSDGGAITSGQRKLGSISAGDLDIYTFTAGIGESFLLSLGDVGGNAFVPEMVVYTPTGSRLDFNYNNVGSIISAKNLAASGTYYVVINDNSGTQTGDYALALAKLPAAITTDPNDPDGGAITSGQRKRGSIDIGDLDIFTFTASANQAVVINLGDVAGTAFVPEMVFYSPTGAQLDFNYANDGSVLGSNSLAISGTYYIVVLDANGTNSGEYALSFANSAASITPDPLDTDGGAITNGERRVGTIATGDNDVFSFTANIGQSAILTLGDLDASGFVPQMNVYTPSGALLDFNYGQNGSRLEFDNLAVSGTYRVVVFDNGGDVTGRYALSLARSAAAVAPDATDTDGGTLAVGDTRIGALPMGDTDVYTFSASGGAAMTINLRDLLGDAFVPRITVYAPNGNYVDSTTNGTLASLAFTTAASGTYMIVVADSGGGATGTYSLGLNVAAPTADTVAPKVMKGTFDWTKSPHEIRFGFSESVLGTVDFDDLVLRNNTTGETLDNGLFSAVYDPNNYEAVFTFPAATFGLLGDGDYTATYGAGKAADAVGNVNAAFSFNFFVLAGDINHDRTVNFTDLLILAQNYGKIGRTFSEGNIDYSPTGNVAFSDLLSLAQNYGKTIAPPVLVAASATTTKHRSVAKDVLA